MSRGARQQTGPSQHSSHGAHVPLIQTATLQQAY